MKYYKCVNQCGYYVTQDDSRCSNCGSLDPLGSLDMAINNFRHKDQIVNATVVLSITFSVIIPVAGLIAIFYYGVNALPFIILFLAAALLTAVARPVGEYVGTAVSEYFDEKRNKEIETKYREITAGKISDSQCLMETEKTICQRAVDINNKIEQVKETSADVRLNVENKKEQLLDKLEQDRVRLLNLQVGYELIKYEIEVIRLRNRLDGFIYIYDRFSYEEIQGMQKSVLQVKKNAQDLKQELSETFAGHSGNPKLVELNELLSDMVVNAQSLYDALAEMRGRVINDDIENISLENKERPLLLPMNAREEFEKTSIHVERFAKDFNDLEYEYNKLKI